MIKEKIAKYIYEATRIEAGWSGRSIVPERWNKRDKKFRIQFTEMTDRYISLKKLPTPTEAHNSWMESYFKMGWKYGKERNVKSKTHPDLTPFDQLPKDERDKDAIFLAFVWLTKKLLNHPNN